MGHTRIYLSTTEVLAISQHVDRLSAELDDLNPADPTDAARIEAIMDELYRDDRTISTALTTPSRAHLKLVG